MDKVIECVPNFSIGKNIQFIEPIVNAIKSVGPFVKILDYSSDIDHGRLVVTFIGDGDSLRDAAYEGAKKAVELINIHEHKGVHPCIGAVDVIPFVPLLKATFNDCVKIRNEVAEKISNDLSVPVFIYGSIARLPERKDLSSIRKGGIEGLTERICTPDGKPDFGPTRMHPTAGAVAIGAREILIAFNINLESNNIDIAKDIASKIREKNKGLRGIRAIGVFLETKNTAQVAINITNHKTTGVRQVFDAVKALAEKNGTKIISSEIIGLIPKEATFPDMQKYLNLEEWDDKKILESYL